MYGKIPGNVKMSMKKILVLLLAVCILLPTGFVLIQQNEGVNPQVTVDLPSSYIKKSCTMKIEIKDLDAGLRSVQVSIMQKGNDRILLKKNYHPSFFSGILPGSAHVAEDQFTIPVEMKKYGMSDGPAMIRVRVSDASWRGWGRGNIVYLEKEIVLDSTPPKLKILTRKHNLSKGGSGLIIYQVFEPDVKTGVKVGDHIFPGYPGLFENPMIHAAFFALDHTQGPGTKLVVFAQDKAGNLTQRGFRHYIRDKRFIRDTINISDGFLEGHIPEFDLGSRGKNFGSLLDTFLFINSKIREENSRYILGAVADNTVNSLMWKGKFIRMRGAATRSKFADKRTYKYKGKDVSKAVHLGIDLASTVNDRIKAANSGKVIFAEQVGIFGNTVIIDHGFGVASLYAHMDSIAVQVGQEVKKGEYIGTTGTTGLVGGDHLHFSMIVHDVFVNPLEWWDAAWVKNNITSKIQRMKKTTR